MGVVDGTDLEWEQPRDWNKELQDRKERIEKEEATLAARLRIKARKEKGWELRKVCKELLEHIDQDWNKRKEKKQDNRIGMLPKETQKKLEQELERTRIKELK